MVFDAPARDRRPAPRESGHGFCGLLLIAFGAVIAISARSWGLPEMLPELARPLLWIGLALLAGGAFMLARRLHQLLAKPPAAPAPDMSGLRGSLVARGLQRRLVEPRFVYERRTETERITGRLPSGAEVEVVADPARTTIAVRGAEPPPPLDVSGESIPERLRRSGAPTGLTPTEVMASRVFGARKARRLWTDGPWLRAELDLRPSMLTAAWAEDTLDLLGELPSFVPLLNELVEREERRTVAPGARVDVAAVAAAARNPYVRAFALAIDGPDLQQGVLEEVVSGRVAGRRVSLRLSGREPPVISFDVPWRAALDVGPDEVHAGKVETGDEQVRAALSALFDVAGAQRLVATARRARVTLQRPDADPAAWVKQLVGLVAGLSAVRRAPIVLQAKPAADDATCPYCRDAASPDAPDVQACATCDTPHHAECLEEAGGCTVLGCAGRAPRPPASVRG